MTQTQISLSLVG